MKLSDAMQKALDELIKGNVKWQDVNGNTLKALDSRGLLDMERKVPNQDGLAASTVPMRKVPVRVFGKPVTYSAPYLEGENKETAVAKYDTFTMPKNTEMIVTFGFEFKDRKRIRYVLEGYINMGGKLRFIKVYEAPHMESIERLMPILEETDGRTLEATT